MSPISASIIDVHVHAMAADDQGPPPLSFDLPVEEFPVLDPRGSYEDAFMGWFKEPRGDRAVRSPLTDDELRDQTLEIMERRNIVGVVSGFTQERVADWRSRAPDRVIPARAFAVGRDDDFTPDDVRRLHAAGELAVLGEVANQYYGVEPNDERFEPYLAVCEELDIPIGIHVGPGPPGSPYLGWESYRARLQSPLLLEEPLLRHPRLRRYAMHAGWPMLDDMLAMLYVHPQLHVDTGVIAFALPRPEFHRYLRALVEAGFSRRIMFGSDNMVWPGAIEYAIESIEAADFLTDEQKRAILHDNAARFLRL
ncbi:MAG: amidohydrolase [Chloroflexi bacterium]|nr:amidohydrolase [Chloroflexota bacterium]